MFAVSEIMSDDSEACFHEDVNTSIGKQAFSLLSDDERESYSERAAIMQYCGGLSRSDAERQAYAPFRIKKIDYEIANFGLYDGMM